MTQTMNTRPKRGTYPLKPETLAVIKRYFKKYPDASDYEASRDLKKHIRTIRTYKPYIGGGA